MSMLQSVQDAVMKQVMASPMGVKITAEAKRKIFQERRVLVAQREQLEADFEKRRPGLEKACDAASLTLETRREALKEAERAHAEAVFARSSAATAVDFARDRQINVELRSTADPGIDDFLVELRARAETVRQLSAAAGEEIDVARGTRRVLSCRPAILRTLVAITAARQAAEDLKISAVEDVDEAIATLRAAIPEVGGPEVIAEERLTWPRF